MNRAATSSAIISLQPSRSSSRGGRRIRRGVSSCKSSSAGIWVQSFGEVIEVVSLEQGPEHGETQDTRSRAGRRQRAATSPAVFDRKPGRAVLAARRAALSATERARLDESARWTATSVRRALAARIERSTPRGSEARDAGYRLLTHAARVPRGHDYADLAALRAESQGCA